MMVPYQVELATFDRAELGNLDLQKPEIKLGGQLYQRVPQRWKPR